MLETERRSAISTSQLGLYSDYGERYSRSRYSSITKKFTIGVMVVVTVLLVAIFLYDFTTASSVNSKLNQETKHIYILQNALKKPSNVTKKFTGSTVLPDVNNTGSIRIEDRSDNENPENPFSYTDEHKVPGAEYRSQNLNNFKLRKRVLKSIENRAEEAEGKQLFDNHALVYRVRQRYKRPDSSEEIESSEETRPVPFHWELKTPPPTAFKRPRYPQLSQYRSPHASRNIQEIIKYLTNEDVPNRGIKFTGVYVNPKKYDTIPEFGGMTSTSDRSEEEDDYSMNDDPFYMYKPKHPADVNLLATSNVRFSPTGLHRYTYDTYGRPVSYIKPSALDPQFENSAAYSSSYSKKRKPKPFSVMLDIYPITDVLEQNKKITRPKQVPVEDYDLRRPIQFNRGTKFYTPLPQSMPNLAAMDEEERQQMIFHLNLYPRKKNKMTRHDIIHRSESMQPEERQQFMEKVWTPLETIAKHVAVERSRLIDNEMEDNLAANRYQETNLDNDDGKRFQRGNDSSILIHTDLVQNESVPSNHKSSMEEDYASTEKYEFEAQKIMGTTISECEDCNTTIPEEEKDANQTISADITKDIDTVEGFKRFSESVSKNI